MIIYIINSKHRLQIKIFYRIVFYVAADIFKLLVSYTVVTVMTTTFLAITLLYKQDINIETLISKEYFND